MAPNVLVISKFFQILVLQHQISKVQNNVFLTVGQNNFKNKIPMQILIETRNRVEPPNCVLQLFLFSFKAKLCLTAFLHFFGCRHKCTSYVNSIYQVYVLRNFFIIHFFLGNKCIFCKISKKNGVLNKIYLKKA